MSEPEEGGLFKAPFDVNDSGRIDLIPMVNLPPTTRWASTLGISSWFPIKYRSRTSGIDSGGRNIS